jgi:hypothetical protein
VTLLSLLSWYALTALGLILPRTETACPVGFYVEGIRADGYFRCGEVPPADVCPGPQGCDDDTEYVELVGILLCPSGERPINVDGRRIACQAVRT